MPPNTRSAEPYKVHYPASLATRLHDQPQQQQATHSDSASRQPLNLPPDSPPSVSDSARQSWTRRSGEPPRPSRRGRADQPASASNKIAALRPAFSEAHTETAAESTIDDPYQLLDQSYWPRRKGGGVSSRTSSAVLWVLEEGIRRPFPFTPVWQELSAPMTDVDMSGSSNKNGASYGPVPVLQPHQQQQQQSSGGVRTPTDIMRQRRDREARKKAEQDARDREQEASAERSRRRQEQQSRQTQSQQQWATHRKPVGQTRQQEPAASQGFQSTPRQAPNPAHQQAAQKLQGQTVQLNQPVASQTAAPLQQQHQQPRRSTFPHAFERWESLSSHWEGLTGYWIRKLEQNGGVLDNDPISQQMSRQIADLSAAGANLFHAVVELQRLRASSERKFQRWFFDTRAEQERAREIQGQLEGQLNAERQTHAEAFSTWQSGESEKAKNEELIKEMRRELQISKEEARRAWEELGRREQEERNRTQSLRSGEPTLVGGVQVVPMIQGLPSRQQHNPGSATATRPPTRDGPYAGGPGPASMSGQQKQREQGTSSRSSRGIPDPGENINQYYEERSTPPVGTNPYTHTKLPTATTTTTPTTAEPINTYRGQQRGEPSSVGGSGSGGGYINPPPPPPTTTTTREEPEPDPAEENIYTQSDLSSSEPEEEYTHTPYAEHHEHILSYPPTLSDDSEDYIPEDEEETFFESGESSRPIYPGFDPEPVDYSGSSWGSEWDSITPRHRHPTRLSDVMEEDEPSRTTPSRASLTSRSRSLHFS